MSLLSCEGGASADCCAWEIELEGAILIRDDLEVLWLQRTD